MPVRIGLIGCGGIAGLHMRGYKECGDALKFVACCDIIPERAQNFVKTHGFARAYTDYRKMLASEKLDAISVCTPNYAHCEPTVAALEAGIHVLCEKPIAMNAFEAQMMVDAANRSGAMLTIGHQMRFFPAVQHLKKMLDAGELGEIYFGRSLALRRRGIPGWGQFHIKEKSGGGPLIDIGVHALDLIMWLMGSPEPANVMGSVYTHFGNKKEFHSPWGDYRREEYDVEDFACGMVKFRSGSTLLLEASWAGHLPEPETFPQMLLGDRGGAVVNPFVSTKQLRVFMSRGEALVDVEPHGFPQVEAHIEELKHWVACLQGKKEVLVRPEESLNVQLVLDAVYQSSETGREVVIEEHAPRGEAVIPPARRKKRAKQLA